MKTALVCGAGGFLGTHLVNRLKSEGYWVRGVDLKYPEFSQTQADDFVIADLLNADIVREIIRDSSTPYTYYPRPFESGQQFDEIAQLACNMGGAGYVFTGDHDADIMTSVLINMHLCEALKNQGFKGKVFYSSSACMYPMELQNGKDGWLKYPARSSSLSKDYYESGLKESDGFQGPPDSEYGYEKLFSERVYMAYARNYKLDIRIARFHNIYGPEGTYKGGKEKAPAAMCRKAILAEDVVEVWGDGLQTRSFLYVSDCIDAVRFLMNSDHKEPINIGSEEMVSINELAGMAIQCSGKSITINHIDGPTGVRGRNSDNTVIRQVLNWEPKVSLQQGIYKTFQWINSQINK